MEAQVPPNVRVKAKKGPYRVELTAGQTIYFCDCGRSKNQPYCDGAHAGTEFGPIAFTAPETKAYFMCGCKYANIKPMCDGQHNKIEW
ncbi:hypothetical protein SteCoe_22348 [Stentor coeruleus]|uniref:Iron-binding zinc finger CDGSH type domain-containing protein n=1 Tax=Stentor coeruleus TaxID=5963 RepID=A0A1R2BMJ6_9CILI|nr:hypothetical protein SteCoe_22348 [Stentor coeruleus]